MHALLERLLAHPLSGRRRDLVVETVDGEAAATSRLAPLLRELGFRGQGRAMRFYAPAR